jgi:hypothetical protein
MHVRTIVSFLLTAVAFAADIGRAEAASQLVETVQTHLYAGETNAAAAAAEAALAATPTDGEARFALGAVQFLQAIENLGQAFHRYGLNNGESVAGLAGLPLFRLPVPPNATPEKIDYDALRGVLGKFVDDLGKAEATLSGVNSTALDLPLNIGLIRFDLDGDGKGSEQEGLGSILAKLGGSEMSGIDAANPLLVDFDASDVPWLRAYCHLLMALAEFPLAHDWRAAFESTFQGLFPRAELPLSRAESFPLPDEYRMYPAVADLIAFIHLLHWPVAEPQRMRSVLAHLEAIPPLSRENWTRIQAETDDGNEWLPNPHQTGFLPGVTVTQGQIDGWMLLLDESEALLQGRKLLPHWRFDKGINVRRMFLEPTTFDLVLLIQGSAAIPYLETGEMSTGVTWQRIGDLLGGNFIGYAIWFN